MIKKMAMMYWVNTRAPEEEITHDTSPSKKPKTAENDKDICTDIR